MLIAALLSILLPALTSARMFDFRQRCQGNQRIIGQAWQNYLGDHGQQFPTVPVQPAWFYGGARFSAVNETAFPDMDRPLTPYLDLPRSSNHDEFICNCPADRGISDPQVSVGTGKRTAFRSFGTSYRANAALLLASMTSQGASGDEAELRGLRRREITTAPSRLLLMGDPVWYEVAESTGRNADWHGQHDAGNLLFLDGSVRFQIVKPRRIVGPIVFDPMMRGSRGTAGE